MKIVFAGDSITAAQYVSEGETFAKLISDALGATYVNSGVSGSSAAGLLTNVQARVLDHAPSSAVVMIGTNDLATALENDTRLDVALPIYLGVMAPLIDAILAAGIHLIVLSPPATKIPKLWAMQPAWSAGLAELCAAKGVAFIDVFARMAYDGRSMSASNFSAWWLPEPLDLYHLSATGHSRIPALVLATQMPVSAPETETGTVMDVTFDTSFGNMTGSTAKVQIKKAAITAPPSAVTKMRLTLRGHADEPLQLASLYVGHRSGADAWDAASLTQVKVSGAGSITVPQAGTLVTDWITFAWDRTSDLILSFYANGSAAADKLAAKSDANGVTHHKSGDEAASANASGFTSYASYLSLASKIETDGF